MEATTSNATNNTHNNSNNNNASIGVENGQSPTSRPTLLSKDLEDAMHSQELSAKDLLLKAQAVIQRLDRQLSATGPRQSSTRFSPALANPNSSCHNNASALQDITQSTNTIYVPNDNKAAFRTLEADAHSHAQGEAAPNSNSIPATALPTSVDVPAGPVPTPPPTTSNNSKRYLSSVQLFLQHPPNSHNDNDIDDVDEDEENEEGMGLVVDGQHHGTHHDTTSNDTQQQSLSIYNGDLDPHYNNDNNHSNNINETDDPSADVSSSASTTSSSLRVYDTTHDYDDEIISQCSSNAETKHVQYWMEDDAMLLYNHQQHRQHQRQNAIPPPSQLELPFGGNTSREAMSPQHQDDKIKAINMEMDAPSQRRRRSAHDVIQRFLLKSLRSKRRQSPKQQPRTRGDTTSTIDINNIHDQDSSIPSPTPTPSPFPATPLHSTPSFLSTSIPRFFPSTKRHSHTRNNYHDHDEEDKDYDHMHNHANHNNIKIVPGGLFREHCNLAIQYLSSKLETLPLERQQRRQQRQEQKQKQIKDGNMTGGTERSDRESTEEGEPQVYNLSASSSHLLQQIRERSQSADDPSLSLGVALASFDVFDGEDYNHAMPEVYQSTWDGKPIIDHPFNDISTRYNPQDPILPNEDLDDNDSNNDNNNKEYVHKYHRMPWFLRVKDFLLSLRHTIWCRRPNCSKRQLYHIVVALIVIVFLAIVITIIVVLAAGGNSSSNDIDNNKDNSPGITTLPPTTSSSGSADNGERFHKLRTALINITGDESLPSTVDQLLAMEWMTVEDPAQLEFSMDEAPMLLDRFVMVLFFNTRYDVEELLTPVDDNNNLAWMTNSSICSWRNLTCKKDMTLSKLDISNGVGGQVPTELGFLVNLQSLSITQSWLGSSIPTELGHLTQLTNLNLRHNNLVSKIPNQIGQLTNLMTLHLDNNYLSGSIPQELSNLVNIQEMNLSSNFLTGTVPLRFSDLVSSGAQIQMQSNVLLECDSTVFSC